MQNAKSKPEIQALGLVYVLTMLIAAMSGCKSNGDGAPPDAAGDMSTAPPGDGSAPIPSYSTSMVTSACDDLSAAEILKLGATTHVTTYKDLPFPFSLFGEPATRFVIAEPGHIYLGGRSLFVATAGDPQLPPNSAIPNGWVAPFWDSLLTYIPNMRGDVRVLHTGTGADERFVLGYNDFTLAFPSSTVPNPDVHLSFQVALLRQSQAIELRYCQLDAGPSPTPDLRDRVLGGSAEIGLESNDGTLGISYSFKMPLKQAGIAVRFTPTP